MKYRIETRPLGVLNKWVWVCDFRTKESAEAMIKLFKENDRRLKRENWEYRIVKRR